MSTDKNDVDPDVVYKENHDDGFCDICGQWSTKGILHHTDPSRKTKEPRALGKKDRREKSDLIYVCRVCHGKIHAKLQKSIVTQDEEGNWVKRKIYSTDNPEAAIWK